MSQHLSLKSSHTAGPLPNLTTLTKLAVGKIHTIGTAPFQCDIATQHQSLSCHSSNLTIPFAILFDFQLLWILRTLRPFSAFASGHFKIQSVGSKNADSALTDLDLQYVKILKCKWRKHHALLCPWVTLNFYLR